MTDAQCVAFLQWALPRLRMRWPGFRKVRRQVHKRINRRMEELGLDEVSQYRAYLESHPDEWTVLDRFCRIPISRFYRDRGVFDHLGDPLLGELARAVHARGESEVPAWCAGCASGEEPYTLAILWGTVVRPRFPELRLRLLATDADEQMLQRARRAVYAASSLKDVPREWLDTAFARDAEEYVLRPEFRDAVEFRLQDIRAEMPEGPFRLVLCRHLAFTYFDEDLQRTILRRIAERLLPDGLLMAGKQEPLPEGQQEFESCRGNLGIYRISPGRCTMRHAGL
ncbi:MAG TPA: CheR family methyltransferase [Thermoguttaceae bacterium]|nr:CheR family methyltransferase [Thermoguttaceae bacterium]